MMMVNKTVGQTTGHTDTALISDAIPIIKNVSTKIVDKEVVAEGSQSTRLEITIVIREKDCWIKLQAAAIDNDIKGIFMPRDTVMTIEANSMYFGEISAISEDDDGEAFITIL